MPPTLGTKVNRILLAVFVLTLSLLIGLLVFGPSATKATLSVFGVTSTGDENQTRIDGAVAAARAEVSALFTSDYRQVDSWEKAVTQGATGALLNGLQSRMPDTKAQIVSDKLIGVGDVLGVGLNTMTAPTATNAQWSALLYVSVATQESRVAFKAVEKTAACPAKTLCNRYVLQVNAVQTPDGWKISQLGRVSQ